MNRNYFAIFDFETTGINPHICHITELACIILDTQLKEISRFHTLMQPDDVDAIEQKVLDLTHKTKEMLREAPLSKVAWTTFVNWISQYNTDFRKTVYGAPILCGYNILGYDLPILRRYAKMYGGWDTKRNDQNLFNQIYQIDLMHQIFLWTENITGPPKLKLSIVSEWMGMSEEMTQAAHGAMADVEMCQKILVKLLKLSRYLVVPDENGKAKLSFAGAFKNEK